MSNPREGFNGSEASIAQSVCDLSANAELDSLSLESAASIDRVALDWLSHSCLP